MGTMGCIGPVIDFEIVPGFETVLETSMGTMGCIGPVIDFETVLGTVRILDKLGRLGNPGSIGLDLGFGFAIVLDSIVCSIGLGTVLVIDHHVQIDPGTDVGTAIGLRVRIDSGIDVEIGTVLHGRGYFEIGFGTEIGVRACSIGLGIGTVLGIVLRVQIGLGTDVGTAIGLRVRIDSGIGVEIGTVLHGRGYFGIGFGTEIGVRACSIGLGIGTVLGIV